MSEQEESKCKCPNCNCFSGLVHVPTSGTFIVFPGGRVSEVSEANYVKRVDNVTVYFVVVPDAD